MCEWARSCVGWVTREAVVRGVGRACSDGPSGPPRPRGPAPAARRADGTAHSRAERNRGVCSEQALPAFSSLPTCDHHMKLHFKSRAGPGGPVFPRGLSPHWHPRGLKLRNLALLPPSVTPRCLPSHSFLRSLTHSVTHKLAHAITDHHPRQDCLPRAQAGLATRCLRVAGLGEARWTGAGPRGRMWG